MHMSEHDHLSGGGRGAEVPWERRGPCGIGDGVPAGSTNGVPAGSTNGVPAGSTKSIREVVIREVVIRQVVIWQIRSSAQRWARRTRTLPHGTAKVAPAA